MLTWDILKNYLLTKHGQYLNNFKTKFCNDITYKQPFHEQEKIVYSELE